MQEKSIIDNSLASVGRSLFHRIAHQKAEEYSEESYKTVEQENTRCCRFVEVSNLQPINISFELQKKTSEKDTVVFSTDVGIFKLVDGKTSKICPLKPEKIIYDQGRHLLLWLTDSVVHIAEFHEDTATLEFHCISTQADDFFFVEKSDDALIILLSKHEYSSYLTHIYTAKTEESNDTTTVKIEFKRKLFIGHRINNIDLIHNRLVLAANVFEIIDIETLRTNELLELYDPFTEAFVNTIDNLVGKKAFKIDADTFLLCFNGAGFYIDSTGRYKHHDILFNWDEEANDFKIKDKYILVLGEFYFSVFCLETGALIQAIPFKNGRFVSGTSEILFYNKEGVFQIEEAEKQPPTVDEEIQAVPRACSQRRMSIKSKTSKASDYTQSDDGIIKNSTKKPKAKQLFNKKKTPVEPKEFEQKIKKVIEDRNKSDDKILVDIITAYEEKFENYKLLRLKMVDCDE